MHTRLQGRRSRSPPERRAVPSRISPPPCSRDADIGGHWPLTGSSRLELYDENRHKDQLGNLGMTTN